MHALPGRFGTLTLHPTEAIRRQPLIDANTALPLRKLHL